MNRENIYWKGIIKEGNIVKVRQWDDMKREFGISYERGQCFYHACRVMINCSKKFTEDMEKYCGKTIKINKNMEKKFNECGYFYYEDYVFSTDMLEPYMIIEKEKEDLFMKIQEVMELKDGSRVRTNNGKIYIVNDGNLISEDNGNSLTVNYGLKEIFDMEFELIKVKLEDVLIPGNIVEIMDSIESRRKLGVILNNDNICYFDGGFDSLSYERYTINDPDYYISKIYISKVYEPLFGFNLANIQKEKMKLSAIDISMN